MRNHPFLSRFLAGLCLLACAAPAWAAAQAGITAQIQPQSIRLGESAQLLVSVQGAQNASPNVPRVDGLDIVPVGQQSSMQIINGAVSANATLIYQVIPDRAGDFRIPPITASGAGSTQPVSLRVEPGAGGSNHRTAPASRPSTAGFALDDDAAPVESNGELAFLRVLLPKDELFVGELVPVKVKAYFRAGVSASLNGLPMLSSDAFTLNPLDGEPVQTREMIDGVPHTVVTWTSALSAVKAGDYPLDLELPVMVRVREPGRQRRSAGRDPFQDFFGGNSPFSDPFFDDFFGSVSEKPLTLRTSGSMLKIRPLPAEGRPEGFSGAVGQFEVTGEVSSKSATTGEPLTLTLKVTGRGNFDRVLSEGLAASPEWKTYKPGAEFEPGDAAGISGTKTFEQAIVPMTAGAQEIPGIRFSYFDPEQGAYVTRTTEPIPVRIEQGSVSAPAPVTSSTTVERDQEQKPTDGLASDKETNDTGASTLRPLVLAPWYLALNGAMLVLIAVGVAFRAIRDRRVGDPERRRRESAERVVRESIDSMDAAILDKDAPRFFEAARRALQERLAARWQVSPSQVTIPEIHARLDGRGEEVSAVFRTADEIAYSGQRFTAPDLQKWRELIKTQLLQLAGQP